MSAPEPDWPAQRNINLRSGAGQAGGGPLDGRVSRQFTNVVGSLVLPLLRSRDVHCCWSIFTRANFEHHHVADMKFIVYNTTKLLVVKEDS
jgi:hypothetical protein